MPKKRRSYTLKEQRTLTVIASMPDSRERRSLVKTFTRDSKRTKPAVYSYLNRLRGNQPGRKKEKTPVVNEVRFKIKSMIISGEDIVVTY